MNWQDIVNELVKFAQNLLVLALLILIPFVFDWIRNKTKSLKEQYKLDENYWLTSTTRIAVLASEQMKKSGFIDDKKQYAVEYVDKFLKSRGINLDVKLIEGLVESAVLDEFNKK